jgi:hypothetical protein
MSEKQLPTNPSDAELMEMFIDGLMSDAEAEQFLANTSDPQEALRQREFQNQIDEALCRSFKFDAIDEDVLTQKITGDLLLDSPAPSTVESHKTTSRRKLAAVQGTPWFKAALAASLLLAIGFGAWMGGGSRPTEIGFTPRALAMVYQETKSRGFRPYYNCNDDEKRFADTFQARHGQRLALSSMPEGTRMLGLSYPGGISRNTTAMLGEVDGRSVMVFVDDANHRDQAIVSVEQDSNLNVFRVEKNGLIFCEVTPLSAPRLIQHFEFPDSQ